MTRPPYPREVAELIARADRLTPNEAERLALDPFDTVSVLAELLVTEIVENDSSLQTTWRHARDAAEEATLGDSFADESVIARRYAAWWAVSHAVLALVLRDELTQEQFELLSRKWNEMLAESALREARNEGRA